MSPSPLPGSRGPSPGPPRLRGPSGPPPQGQQQQVYSPRVGKTIDYYM
jgi:hypothetical protein